MKNKNEKQGERTDPGHKVVEKWKMKRRKETGKCVSIARYLASEMKHDVEKEGAHGRR